MGKRKCSFSVSFENTLLNPICNAGAQQNKGDTESKAYKVCVMQVFKTKKKKHGSDKQQLNLKKRGNQLEGVKGF